MNPSLNDHVAAEVRAELARRLGTREELAKGIGVSPATLQRRLTGQQAFTIDELERVAEFFRLPIETFLRQTRVAS